MHRFREYLPFLAFFLAGIAVMAIALYASGSSVSALLPSTARDGLHSAAFAAGLLLLGLSHVLSYRLGYRNIAAAGEFLFALTAETLLAEVLPLWAAALVGVGIGGALGLVIGLLRAYSPVREGVSGFLLCVLAIGWYLPYAALYPRTALPAVSDSFLAGISLFGIVLAAVLLIVPMRRGRTGLPLGRRRSALWILSLSGAIAGLAAGAFLPCAEAFSVPAPYDPLYAICGFFLCALSLGNPLLCALAAILLSLAPTLFAALPTVPNAVSAVAVAAGCLVICTLVPIAVRRAEARRASRTEARRELPPSPQLDPYDDEEGEIPTISKILKGE